MKLATFRPAAFMPRPRPRLQGDPPEGAPEAAVPDTTEKPSAFWPIALYLSSIAVVAGIAIYGYRQIERGAPGWR